MRKLQKILWCFILSPSIFLSCEEKNTGPSKEIIETINLKRGQVISCGATDKQFGSVDFEMSCDQSVKQDFNLAVELLHSFEYDESEKIFAKIIDEHPECAMAYWGIAMSNLHPLWTAPTEAELKKGSKAIEIARSFTKPSEKEAGYINAIGSYYENWQHTAHPARCLQLEKSMEALHVKYPSDKEAAIFYALSLVAAADPSDKSYVKQKKAGVILNSIYPSEPNHPGIIHYIIHTYDYPELAALALPSAKKYAAVAPSSAHALHMPSHIFTRLGLWDECIQSNLGSVDAAKCYATSAGIKGHWDEELHGMDYLVYGYLQKGENELAKQQLNYLDSIDMVYPTNFKVAYAFAAIPSRIALENKNWREAALLKIHPVKFPWKDFPWQEAIFHFTKMMGAARLGNLNDANTELKILNQLRDTLENQKDSYKAKQVAIQIKAGEAWIQFEKNNRVEALKAMKLAADMEDSTEKHPVTPGEIIPARELLGDMFMEMHDWKNALDAYETELKKAPGRFNALCSAGDAAGKIGDKEKAKLYYGEVLKNADAKNSVRPELDKIRGFMKEN